MITQIFTTNNVSRRRGFTFAELMLVIVILALVAGFSGSYYMGTYKKESLRTSAKALLLMGQFARMYAIEQGRTCRLHVDDVGKRFYLVGPVFVASSQKTEQKIISNPYCRKKTLGNGIEFEFVDIEPATRGSEAALDDNNCIHFYPDGSCDSAVVQMGNGRHSMTALFSSAYAKITVFEGVADEVEETLRVIDLDAAD
ncbi:MAG: pilus assembly FimT family protein [Planctomycetota bacterium]